MRSRGEASCGLSARRRRRIFICGSSEYPPVIGWGVYGRALRPGGGHGLQGGGNPPRMEPFSRKNSGDEVDQLLNHFTLSKVELKQKHFNMSSA